MIAPLHLPLAGVLDVIDTVWEYVFGFCYRERDPDGLLSPGMERYVSEHRGTCELPRLEAIFSEHDVGSIRAARGDREDRFERNLARLLDRFAANRQKSK